MFMENLMNTRYKVIDDYPQSKLPIGSILEFDQEACWITLDGKTSTPEPHYGSAYWVTNNLKPSLHKNIFKRLKWWECRPVEDLPEYANLEGKVMEFWRAHILSLSLDDFILEPATKEEYELTKNGLLDGK